MTLFSGIIVGCLLTGITLLLIVKALIAIAREVFLGRTNRPWWL